MAIEMDMWKNVENIPSFWSHRIKPIKRLLQDDDGIQSSRIANDHQSHETNDAKKQWNIWKILQLNWGLDY